MKRILIMGLPGSGKTTLASRLHQGLTDSGISVDWFNADTVRQLNNDWDFSHQGRLRQTHRMQQLARDSSAQAVICDFVAPLAEMREIFQADFTIWLDTIKQGRYTDTNHVFEPPNHCDLRILSFLTDQQISELINHVKITLLNRL